MVKFWNTPLLTVGALTHDFSQKKTSCDDEYHMLTRVGSLGFRDVALFLVSVMDHYSWRRVMLVYDKDGYRRVSGEHTCKLMMEALVKRLKQHNLQFRAFDTEKAANQGVKEHLRREVGNDFSARKGRHEMFQDLPGQLGLQFFLVGRSAGDGQLHAAVASQDTPTSCRHAPPCLLCPRRGWHGGMGLVPALLGPRALRAARGRRRRGQLAERLAERAQGPAG
ncbi:uncharacterized protein LOC113214563 isoform X3 [Frankliniella occidentalis]|uniref:Uncharacterized protein LOC113214563 isoform X3 n=1 Tax=Frankliniella occidentalis TaxID=133901 RepID=A0A9C6WYZ7_FRAOC|nr:uncharacterized protein LOC113214563 isoform X3 [Frankliniella occidentalis]